MRSLFLFLRMAAKRLRSETPPFLRLVQRVCAAVNAAIVALTATAFWAEVPETLQDQLVIVAIAGGLLAIVVGVYLGAGLGTSNPWTQTLTNDWAKPPQDEPINTPPQDVEGGGV